MRTVDRPGRRMQQALTLDRFEQTVNVEKRRASAEAGSRTRRAKRPECSEWFSGNVVVNKFHHWYASARSSTGWLFVL